MSEQKVRWGILSTANIGRKAVAPAIQASQNGRAVAVASRDAGKARAYAAELGIARSYQGYQALLDDEEVEAVYIPLPNSLHKEWTIRAVEAGKHVLCEKPLALTTEECLEMAEAARSKGVLLMEAFMYRFHPRTQAVVDMVRKGTLGDLKVIRSGFTFAVTDPGNIRLQADLGGGSLMDVGCYCVNVSRTLVGDEPVEVQAFAKWSETGVDEEMVASLRFPNGVVAQFNCGLTIHRQEFYQVVGQKSHLDVPAAFLPGKGPVELHHVQSGGGETRQIPGADEYQLMVEHFSDCLEKDMVPRYQASEAAANMRVIEALYRSARNRGELEQVEGRVMGNG